MNRTVPTSLPRPRDGHRPLLLLMLTSLLALVRPDPARAQGALLKDDFSGNRLDTATWTAFTPFNNTPLSTVTVSNGFLNLFRRGTILSEAGFDGPLDIQGRFRFTGDNDTLTLVFRSDLTLTNQFDRRGVQAALQESTGRVFLIPEAYASTPTSGVFVIEKNQEIDFRLVDNGDRVSLFVNDLTSPVLSTTITNRRGNRVALYNLNSTTARAAVDSLQIHPLRTTVFVDNQLVREGPVTVTNAVPIRIQSHFTNSSVYYTLDGSTPSFISEPYTRVFVLSNSATLRAIAYRSDFLESSASAAIEVQLRPNVTLFNETPGGGTVTSDPPGRTFPSNTVVSLTAIPLPGWEFLRWEGAATNLTTNTTVTMTNHLAVRAIFGTRPSVSLLGAGGVELYPTGAVQAYGTRLRLTAVPETGNYFFRWANALTGTSSPAELTVTNATPGVSALFAALASNQVSLTTRIEGAGILTLVPAANVLTNGQPVLVTAWPDEDHVFAGWQEGARGQTNPLRLVLTRSTTLTAAFVDEVRFLSSLSAWRSNEFRLAIRSVPGATFGLEVSSNLTDWIRTATLSNATGTALMVYTNPVPSTSQLFHRAVAP